MLTGIPVRRDIAMTGEITLRGRVLPIGGLKEKLLAALRGGIKKVLIPEENAKDLAEIPDSVKNGLEIVPVVADGRGAGARAGAPAAGRSTGKRDAKAAAPPPPPTTRAPASSRTRRVARQRVERLQEGRESAGFAALLHLCVRNRRENLDFCGVDLRRALRLRGQLASNEITSGVDSPSGRRPASGGTAGETRATSRSRRNWQRRGQMNKLELVEHIAKEAELTKVSAAAALEAVLDGIAKSLKKGDEVRLVGFGTFSVRERAAGKGRNPATGKEIKIAASKNARFKAGAALKASLNKKARQEIGAQSDAAE